MAANNLVYNSYGEKYEVPRVRVSSLNELQRADHIAFHRHSGAYWHHAIVERIDIESDKIHVIEYTNTAKEFIEDNCMPPKIKGLKKAKVVRGAYRLQDEVVYLMKHEICLDPEDVFKRAEDRLGEEKYHPLTNNCEHFAMCCKTGESFSDQINKAKLMVTEQVTMEALTKAASKAGMKLIQIAKTVLKGSKEIPAEVTLKSMDVLIDVAYGHNTIASNFMKTFMRGDFTEYASKTGQEVVNTMLQQATKDAVSQAALKAGQEAIKTGAREVTEEIITQTASQAEREFAKTGFIEGSEQILMQTASKSAAEMGKTLIAGAVLSGFIESFSVVGDIGCKREEMREGKISEVEFETAAKKRVLIGAWNVGGSTVGSAIGSLIPVRFAGGLVGAIVGGISGKFVGNLVANSWL